MNRAEFIACSLAFHAVLLVLAVLLPAPFPSPPSYTPTEFTFVEFRDKTVSEEPARQTSSPAPEPSLVNRLAPALSLSLDEGLKDLAGRINAAAEGHPPRGAPAADDAAPQKPPTTSPVPQPAEAGRGDKGADKGSVPEKAEPAPPVQSQSEGLPANVVTSGEARPVRTGRSAVSFRHQVGWPVPDMIPVDVDPGPAGGSGAAWRVLANSDWIIVTPDKGAGPGRVEVGVLVSSLEVGYHEGVLSITSEAGGLKPCELPVSVMVLPEDPGTPELPHFAWDDYMDGGCGVCHLPEALMPSADFMLRPEFCGLCHNPAGMAASSMPGPGGHPVMVNVTSGGARFPTGGTVAEGAYSDTMYTHLLGGDKVVCVTCHNVMYKPGDFGRSWELTSSTDNRMFRLARGGWSKMGYLVPKIYVMQGLTAMPRLLSGLRGFQADPAGYDCDPVEGTVSFREPLEDGAVVYVTLSNPYLRTTTVNNAMCYDCHSENTHMGLDCLACHVVHGTSNIKAVSESVRTPDGKARKVVFSSRARMGSFTDPASDVRGICDVCHVKTPTRCPAARAANSQAAERTGKPCTDCHSHAEGFGAAPPGARPVKNSQNPLH